MALADLGRTTEAVAAFKAADRRFIEGKEDRKGRSVALYGLARALDNAGRCAEAKRAYDAYAAFVRPTDAKDAEMAERLAAACSGPR